MTNDQRLDRAERILTLMIRAGRRERIRVREMDEKIAILINAQIRTEDQVRKMGDESKAMREESKVMREESRVMREESKAMQNDIARRSLEIFALFARTDDKIARLTEAQMISDRTLSALIDRTRSQ